MKLEDLIDLEAQIAADEGRDAEALRARDRELFAKLPPEVDRGDRHALLGAWLTALRAEGQGPDLGRRVTTGQRLLTYLLFVLGFGGGWGAAAVLLAFEEGGSPVNVGYFLVAIVGVQLAILALLFVALPLSLAFPGLPLVGDLRAVLRWVASLLERVASKASDHLSAETREAWSAGRARLRTRASLYRDVEQWLLLGLTQVFAIAFNLGVLACCLRLVLFSDLAFSWSTTVESIDATLVHAWAVKLSLPWGWLVPDAVPSLDLVKQTQYFRLEGRFAGAVAGLKGDPQLVGQWWRFIIAATVTYGLLPRLAIWSLARLERARTLKHLPLDSADVDRVVRRLQAPQVETRAPRPAPQGAEPAHTVPAPAPAADEPPAADDDGCALVVWREVPTAPALITTAVRRAFGCAVERTLEAGGADGDQAVCEALAASQGRILVLAEGFEAPDKSIRRFLARVRSAAGARRKLMVVLVGEASETGWRSPTPADVTIWRDRLTLLEDPYLGVEPLEATS